MTRACSYIDKSGHRVTVTTTTGRDAGESGDAVHVFPFRAETGDRCIYCLDGTCEQEVHASPTWAREMVVHDSVPAARRH